MLQVKHLLKDQRSLDALVVVEKYANGQASAKELDAARAAARAATWDAASAAASAAAGDAAGDAAWDTVRASVWASARDDAREGQLECFRWVVDGGLTEFEKGRITSVDMWRWS